MTDTFQAAQGRRIVSRTTAEELGTVAHLVVDPTKPAVVGIVIGKGRKAGLVRWDQVGGFGADAIMLTDDTVHPPQPDTDLDLLGRRVLTDAGMELGTIADVAFDPETGVVVELVVGETHIPGDHLRGIGSYAAVTRA